MLIQIFYYVGEPVKTRVEPGPGPWLRAFAWTVLAIGNFANWRAGLRLNVAGASGR